MDIKEFEDTLNDLETRVDRLRALYENWFRGYEKLEPSVARKDCERRVYALRKELPRNTALRFRYNMLFQRYTTLCHYWIRTAKQVEEGTHRLQLQRLRRTKDKRGDAPNDTERKGRSSQAPGPGGYELDLNESLDVSDLLDEHEMDAVAQAVDGPSSYEPPPDAARARATGTFGRPKDMPSAAAAASHGAPAPLAPQRTNAGIAGLSAPPLKAPARAGVAVPPPPASLNPARVAMAGSSAVPPSPGGGGRPPPPPLPGRPNPPAPHAVAKEPAAPGGLSDQRLRRLYDEYTNARRSNNETEVRYESLVRSIEKMLPELHKKHAGKQIDFDVVVKDGRVGLKPRAK